MSLCVILYTFYCSRNHVCHSVLFYIHSTVLGITYVTLCYSIYILLFYESRMSLCVILYTFYCSMNHVCHSVLFYLHSTVLGITYVTLCYSIYILLF